MSGCKATRERLLDGVRGRLAGPEREQFSLHVQGCDSCRKLFEREQALERALGERPQYALPERLRQQLATQVGTSGTVPKSKSVAATAAPRARLLWAAIVVPALAATLLAGVFVRGWGASPQPLVEEAVSDHLRVLYAQHPIEIESGGIHQVKPWFAGKLDFAPVLEFSGDEEFPLQGGAIALFVDRKAATFIFRHRLHTASLFVFRSQGLDFPSRSGGTPDARVRLPAVTANSRGFNVLLWQDHDLGYALVSDMAPSALARLAEKLTAR